MIDINQSRAIISNEALTYTDTSANLVLHSSDLFTGLPANVRQYYRNGALEYWVIAIDGNLQQTSPSADFSLTMDSLLAALPDLLAAQAIAAVPTFALSLPEQSTVKLGESFDFDVLYNGQLAPNLSLNISLLYANLNKTVVLNVPIVGLTSPVQLMFKQAGFYLLQFNDLAYSVEVI